MNGKHFFGWCLLAGFACLAGEVSGPQAQLTLQNEDVLTGTLTGSGDETLLFKSYWSDVPFRIPLTELYRYRSLDPKPSTSTKTTMVVHLQHGGVLTAASLGFSGDTFRVRSSWGEDIELPRSAISMIRFYPEGSLVYEGPTSENPQGVVEDGKWYLTPQVRQWTSKEVEYPTKFLLEMEVETQSLTYVYQLHLFGILNRRSPGSLTLEVSERSLSGSSFEISTANQVRVKNWRKPLLGNPQKQVFRLFGDAIENTYTLFLNDSLVHIWEGEPIGQMIGKQALPVSVRFLMGEAPLELSAFRLFKWEGEPFSASEKKIEGQTDVAVTFTSKAQAGELIELSKKMTRFRLTTNEVVQIPNNELFEIHLQASEIDRNHFDSSDRGEVETLHQGDVLLLDSMSVEGDVLKATVGKGQDRFYVRIPLHQIHRLSFPKTLSEERYP